MGMDVNQLDANELCRVTWWILLLISQLEAKHSWIKNSRTGTTCLENVLHTLFQSKQTHSRHHASRKKTQASPSYCAHSWLQKKHRKEDFFRALDGICWDDVVSTTNVEHAVNNLESMIHAHMNKCMPSRTVRMSSRDPEWMTPLVKSLMRTKSRMARQSNSSTWTVREINKRISDVIRQNRTRLFQAPVGTREWWKNVDYVSQRRSSVARVTLDQQSLVALNDYFAELSHDPAYNKPVPVTICVSQEAPQISERQVWESLKHLKKTATGPDNIPFWLWRDNADILTPVIYKMWNIPLEHSIWPSSWKRAIVNPLPKVDIPKNKSDYRGINITPWQHVPLRNVCTILTSVIPWSRIIVRPSSHIGKGEAVQTP